MPRRVTVTITTWVADDVTDEQVDVFAGNAYIQVAEPADEDGEDAWGLIEGPTEVEWRWDQCSR